MIRYRPVIVQDFVEGGDVGASVYCDAGKIVAFIAHRCDFAAGVYSTLRHDGIRDHVARLAAETGLHGIANFDMRMAPDGEVFLLECNPRVFFTLDLAMLAGVNFVVMGIAGAPAAAAHLVPDGIELRYPRTLLTAPRDWLRCLDRDMALLSHLVSDPLPYLLEKLRVLV